MVDGPYQLFRTKSAEPEYFAVFLRETCSTGDITRDFGVAECELSIPHLFGGKAHGGQVFLVKPKIGTRLRSTAFANARYTVYQCESDRAFAAPFLNPMPVETGRFLDTSWNPPRPAFSPLVSQVDIKNRCGYLPYFGDFEWDDNPRPGNEDNIKIRGSWARENIISVSIPQLRLVSGAQGKVWFNFRAAAQMRALWADWERYGFLENIVSFDGAWVPRYQRKCNKSAVSNHAWGTAFDVNCAQNKLWCVPAVLGADGGVREMVEIANKHGFYWGGHFRTKRDGMHFEVAVPR